MSQTTALDHVGIVGADLNPLAWCYERLGFCLTPIARHAGGRTGNRCVMLRDSYLELLSTIDGGTSATFDRFLKRYAGLHILAFRIDDEVTALDRLRQAWGDVPDAAPNDRALDDADPKSPRARFTLITPRDPPEGRVHLIRHLSPELLWRDQFLHHPNNAISLEEVILVVSEPARSAAWFSVLAGRPVVHDRALGYTLDLPRGRLRLLPPTALPAVLPGTSVEVLPCMVGVTLWTSDENVALKKLLADHVIRHRAEGNAILVDAGGVMLKFIGRGG